MLARGFFTFGPNLKPFRPRLLGGFCFVESPGRQGLEVCFRSSHLQHLQSLQTRQVPNQFKRSFRQLLAAASPLSNSGSAGPRELRWSFRAQRPNAHRAGPLQTGASASLEDACESVSKQCREACFLQQGQNIYPHAKHGCSALWCALMVSAQTFLSPITPSPSTPMTEAVALEKTRMRHGRDTDDQGCNVWKCTSDRWQRWGLDHLKANAESKLD